MSLSQKRILRADRPTTVRESSYSVASQRETTTDVAQAPGVPRYPGKAIGRR